MSFRLDPRLEADAGWLGDLWLCRALLMKDARWPWLILVPRREGVVEIDDLSADNQAALMREIARATRVMRDVAGVEKVNVGALGNVVRALHVHVVGRWRDDPAWPGPVWGAASATPYEAAKWEERRAWFVSRFEFIKV